jgi:3-oxoacyl-[acyl-carrier protein] reductase
MSALEGKVALVTGGARGIGKEIALALARNGADIVITDLNQANLENLVSGRRAIPIVANVGIKSDVEKMVEEAIKTFSKIDILVNSAGITRFAPFLDMTESDWDDVINVNLKGTFLTGQAVARHMVNRKYGKIINISSISGEGALNETMANYGPSKAAVNNLTKVMAIALGPYGINVNSIAPGVIVTELGLTRRTPEEYEKFKEFRASQAALRRVGQVDDVAKVVLFLASDDSSFISGQVICVDGGRRDKI